MLLQIGVVIVSLIGIWIGISLLLLKKYKYGSAIVIAALGIGGLSILNNLTINISSIKRDIGDLKISMAQVISVKQEMSQTVNVINKVEKKVANLEDTIRQYYGNLKVEKIYAFKDESKIKICDGHVSIYLEKVPMDNSIVVSKGDGSVVADFLVVANIIEFYDARYKGRTSGPFDRSCRPDDYYLIKYFPEDSRRKYPFFQR